MSGSAWARATSGDDARGGRVSVTLGDLGSDLGGRVASFLMAELDVLASGLGSHALEKALARQSPEVLIVADGVEHSLLVRLKTKAPATGLLVVAHEPSRLLGTMLLAAGIACIDRRAASADFLGAVRLLAGGTLVFVSADGTRIERRAVEMASELTPRELEVLRHLRLGRSYAEIALRLCISYETVRTHARKIRQKLGVRSAQELIGAAFLDARPDVARQLAHVVSA